MYTKIPFIILGFVLMAAVQAEEDDFLPDVPIKTEIGAGKGSTAAVAADDLVRDKTVFRFAALNDPTSKLDSRLYWHHFKDYCGVETAPVRLLIDNNPVITPQQIVMPYGTKNKYPIEGRKDLANGDHVIIPGNIPFSTQAGKLTSTHPAIAAESFDVRILCVPIRLEAQDQSGHPVPVQIKVSCGTEALLREAANFNPLIIWLPIGLKYDSTLGAFSITGDGKLSADPSELAKNVKLTPTGLCLTTPPAKVQAPKKTYAHVFQHWIPKTDAPLQYYLDRMASPAGKMEIAFSRKQFEALTKTSFSHKDFTWSAFNTTFPCDAAGSRPPTDPLTQSVASEMSIDPADVVWLSLQMPQTIVPGVVNFSLSSKVIGSFGNSVVVADTAASLFLIPYRGRTDFAETETETYSILEKPGFSGGLAKIMYEADAENQKPGVLGQIALPAAAQRYDSRQFNLDLKNLPPGKYHLWVECAGANSTRIPLNVFTFVQRSPFLVHFMSACHGGYATDENGVRLLEEAGIEMVTTGGFGSIFPYECPTINVDLTSVVNNQPAAPPVETCLSPTKADCILQTFLRHNLRQIDFAPRRQFGFYLEGLSYHHSFKPDVDRMIRNLQISTQQIADYPSFWGMNYSWFPYLFGYSEGGVDTDIHKIDRNESLAKNLEKAGLRSLTDAERKWYEANKFSTDPTARVKALEMMQTAVAYWKGQMDFGFGKHNKIYNDAIREIRPETKFALYENAGHDSGKRDRSMFNDMDAVTYESYSDNPEWPMSAPFTTDWARGNVPGRPLWLTVDAASSIEGMMKSMFHAFGRGAAGSGTLVPEGMSEEMVKRHAKGLHFVSQYGAIPTHAIADHRFCILSTAGEQVLGGGAQFGYHAMYYHLMRLGCAATIVDDEDVAKSGVPEGTGVLFIVRQTQPLEPKVADAIATFTQKGGRVIVSGDSKVMSDEWIRVEKPIKDIMQLGGFVTHPQMWEEFENNWRQPLSEALAKAGVPAAGKTDPDRGVVVCLDGGAVHYAVVMAEEKGKPHSVFKPCHALPVSLEGTGWIVRDLARQETLPTVEKDSRTEVAVDLVTEPCTVLALFKSVPATITVKSGSTAKLGSDVILTSDVISKDGFSMGTVPVKVDWINPEGTTRLTLFRAACDVLSFHIANLDQAGTWKVQVQELLTGITATAAVDVAQGATPQAINSIPDVHVPSDTHVVQFFSKQTEKCIIIEPGQERLLPLASKLADKLNAVGIKSRVWNVHSEDYDTLSLRWYPRQDEDVPRWRTIEAGQLVGWRQNLGAFVDKHTRAHIPELGGYGEPEPAYMVGADCILFSGGGMAESLHSVSPWMATPNVPGKGLGRIVVCFSPFLANHDALCLVANDDEGLAKCVAKLPELAKLPVRIAAVPQAPEWKALTASIETRAVPQPFQNFAPVRNVTKLFSTNDGKTVVCLDSKKDNVAFVDAELNVTCSINVGESDLIHSHIDNQGRFWQLSPNWFDGLQHLTQRCINRDGTIEKELLVFCETTNFYVVPTDFEGSSSVGPDGSLAVGSFGGISFLKSETGRWNHFEDTPFIYQRDAIRHPRLPVGTTFSPDGRFVLTTFSTHPPGWGGMNWPAAHPSISETFLFDVSTGKPLWHLHDEDIHSPTYAVHTGFGAVSKEGTCTAIEDYRGWIYIIDRSGKILMQEQIQESLPGGYRAGPKDGVGVWMNASGSLAAFAYSKELILARGKETVHVPTHNICSGCVSEDGTLAVVGCEGGNVVACSPDGTKVWNVLTRGVSPLVAAVGQNNTLVATSSGELLLLDGAGKKLKSVNVLAASERQEHELKRVPGFKGIEPPPQYVEPKTLEIAKKGLGAAPIDAWKAAGATTTAFNKTFYRTDQPITLKGTPPSKESFVHLVYRRPAENKLLSIVCTAGKNVETFVLDLPTPEFRVVDIPIRGATVQITINTTGPMDVAECALYGFKWPSLNLAYVKSGKDATSASVDFDGHAEDEKSAEMDLFGEGGVSGKMKDCKIWSPNPDVDKIQGGYLPPCVNPLQMVDGVCFGNGKLPPWTRGMFMGSWLTIEFEHPMAFEYVAAYESSQKQSQLNRNVAVFTSDGKQETFHNGVINNDQFWHLFPMKAGEKNMKILGVHVIAGQNEGLSEVEAYLDMEK